LVKTLARDLKQKDRHDVSIRKFDGADIVVDDALGQQFEPGDWSD
jgi:hypothetical protein